MISERKFSSVPASHYIGHEPYGRTDAHSRPEKAHTETASDSFPGRLLFFQTAFAPSYPVRRSGHAKLVSITESPAAVRIRVSDKAHVGALKSYLEATECSVRVVGEVTLDVSMPRAPSDAQALREIAIYIKAWQAMNPDGYAHVVGEGHVEPS